MCSLKNLTEVKNEKRRITKDFCCFEINRLECRFTRDKTDKANLPESPLMCVRVCVCVTQPLRTKKMRHKVNFYAGWRAPRGLFWTSVRSVALEKEQWQIWGL